VCTELKHLPWSRGSDMLPRQRRQQRVHVVDAADVVARVGALGAHGHGERCSKPGQQRRRRLREPSTPTPGRKCTRTKTHKSLQVEHGCAHFARVKAVAELRAELVCTRRTAHTGSSGAPPPDEGRPTSTRRTGPTAKCTPTCAGDRASSSTARCGVLMPEPVAHKHISQAGAATLSQSAPGSVCRRASNRVEAHCTQGGGSTHSTGPCARRRRRRHPPTGVACSGDVLRASPGEAAFALAAATVPCTAVNMSSSAASSAMASTKSGVQASAVPQQQPPDGPTTTRRTARHAQTVQKPFVNTPTTATLIENPSPVDIQAHTCLTRVRDCTKHVLHHKALVSWSHGHRHLL
jgi:hypothetical protein